MCAGRRTGRPVWKLPGRSLDAVSDGGARGMAVTVRSGGTEFGLRPAATLRALSTDHRMRPLTTSVALCLLLAIGSVVAQQAPPPGQIRPRPAEGREPEFPAPTIREYKPRSTLVVPSHAVPKAKFPVVDIHSHHPTPMTPAYYETVVKSMDERGLQ